MAEAQLQIFLEKVRQLNAFVALSEADPRLRQALRDCEHHDQVVALARSRGFEIGRRWGEPIPGGGAEESDPERGQPPIHGRSAGSPPSGMPPLVPPPPAGPASVLQAPAPAAWHVQASRTPQCRSLLHSPCPPPGEESFEVLLRAPLWRLERIHSCAAASPEGFWYDQAESEWVMVLQGSARLRFDGEQTDIELVAGDALLIEARRRHRVCATDPAPGTIWLALHWSHP
jgi:cupin 2 domain-containing protein